MVADFGVGVGAVCRDEVGEFLGCVVLQQHVGWGMRVAEARAVFEGVRLAKNLGVRSSLSKVIVYKSFWLSSQSPPALLIFI